MKSFLYILSALIVCSCQQKNCEKPEYLDRYQELLDKEANELIHKCYEVRDLVPLLDTIKMVSLRWLQCSEKLSVEEFDSNLFKGSSRKAFFLSFSFIDTCLKYRDKCESYKAAVAIREYRNACLKHLNYEYFLKPMRFDGWVPVPLVVANDTFLQVSKEIPVLKFHILSVIDGKEIKDIVEDQYGFYLIDITKLKKGSYNLKIEEPDANFVREIHFSFDVPYNGLKEWKSMR